MKVVPEAEVRVSIHTIETEIQRHAIKREANRRITEPEHQLLFWPKDFARKNSITGLEQYRLPDEQLKKLGVQLSKVRK